MVPLVGRIKRNGTGLRKNWATKNRHSQAAPVEFVQTRIRGLEVVGLFRWHEALDTGQQFFFGQVVEGDLRRRFWNTNHIFAITICKQSVEKGKSLKGASVIVHAWKRERR